MDYSPLRPTADGRSEDSTTSRVNGGVTLSATPGGGPTQTDGPAAGAAERLGLTAGMVIQELGWDSDSDDGLRVAIEDAIDADMVDGDYGNVVDA
ncbi:MAG: DUF3052 family protein, partial [Nocardioides sp.]